MIVLQIYTTNCSVFCTLGQYSVHFTVYSVHTIVDSYSSEMPPRVGFPDLVKSRISVSVGSDIFLMSHHNTWPSVEVVKHSVPKVKTS